MKTYRSENYNYVFNENNGFFMRWGATLKDDPNMSPIGPEILDIAVSEICHQGCKMCYKSNVAKGRNMSLETFKSVLDSMPTVLQIAIGIGDIDGNPDLFDMMRYARSKGVVPNLTVNGYRLDDSRLDTLVSLCGAIAVSNYSKDACYGTVKALTDRGLKQVNIHQLLSMETYSQVMELIEDIKNDPRLEKLNAVVFLSLKQRGRGEVYHRLSDDLFKELVDKCMKEGIRFGFDSCTACKFSNAIKDNPDYSKILEMIEPCESGLFSSYVNVEGKFFPCSFTEDGEGLNAVTQDFLGNVWNNPKTILWRADLLENGRNCPVYEV